MSTASRKLCCRSWRTSHATARNILVAEGLRPRTAKIPMSNTISRPTKTGTSCARPPTGESTSRSSASSKTRSGPTLGSQTASRAGADGPHHDGQDHPARNGQGYPPRRWGATSIWATMARPSSPTSTALVTFIGGKINVEEIFTVPGRRRPQKPATSCSSGR